MAGRQRTEPSSRPVVAALGSILALALLCCACVTGRAVPTSSVIDECREIWEWGVLNEETLACFPEVAAAVEQRLCAARFFTHHEANAAGFGYGYPVFGYALVPPRRGFKGFHSTTVGDWKAEHCGETRHGVPFGAGRGGVRWDDLWNRLPEGLVGPWRNCEPPRWEMWDRVRGPRCYLLGSFDVDGADEVIRFAAWNQPDTWFDLGARLRADLVVEGADCGGREWKAGSRISSLSARVLECRRHGRSAVRVWLVTGEGSCERHLPELTAPPWRELCQP